MPDLIVTTRSGEVREVTGDSNRTLMEVLRDEGVEIEALCGGCCSCATCHVFVDAEFVNKLPDIREDEELLLDASSYRDSLRSRLSCQIRVSEQLDGLRLTVAPPE